jgi:hypothetical protein
LEIGIWKFENWKLEIGNWKLEFGNWKLEFGIWDLEFRIWNLEGGIWKLELGSGLSVVSGSCQRYQVGKGGLPPLVGGMISILQVRCRPFSA